MVQNRELDVARFVVEKTNCNLFLTGKAGTGKTTFLRDVRKYTKKKYIVLAPTGIAAVNAGGMTIHSFFQFGFGPYVKGVFEPERKYMMRKEKRELIKNLELIIIDEISMVRADLLDHINDELQRIRHNYKPFGGVQIIMIGDLQQLPPIASGDEMDLLKDNYASMYFFDSKSLKKSEYYCIELKTVYRQTELRFISILNRVRSGNVTSSDLDELNTHYVRNFRPSAGEYYIHLVTHNRMADSINQREMDALPLNSFNFDAKVSGTFPEESFPTSSKLEIKKGAQVMFVKNDPDKRYVNGTIGEVEKVSNNGIYVRVSDKDSLIKVEPTSWENIRYHMDEETHQIESKKIGSFMQYPIKLAWAITIHKSQGLTFDRAIIDAHAAFSPGQAYVALSRCRSLDGVVLSEKLTKEAIITDNTVSEYIERAVPDIELLANTINYEPFDYDRKSEDVALSPSPTKESKSVVNIMVYEALKAWRLAVAKHSLLPSFLVMRDSILADISSALPETISELKSVKGVLPAKVDKYGQEILEVIHSCKSSFIQDKTDGENSMDSNKEKEPNSLGDANVYDALKKWRYSIATESKVPAYVVLHDRTIAEIANLLPKTLPELSEIKGMGPVKIEKYGQGILDVIKNSRDCPSTRVISAGEEDDHQFSFMPKENTKKTKDKTWAISYDMFKRGMDIQQIAEDRNLSVNTIVGHIARYVEVGEVKIQDLVAEDVIVKVSDYARTHLQEEIKLKEIFEYFNQTIPYSDIRLVISYLNSRK